MPRIPKSEPAVAPLVAEIAREAMQIAAEACGVRLDDMTASGRRKARVAFARQLAMYLCHVVGGLSMGEISCAFGRDRTTVGYACHIIEDRRDAPMFDGQVEFLEGEMRERMGLLFARRDRAVFMADVKVRKARANIAR